MDRIVERSQRGFQTFPLTGNYVYPLMSSVRGFNSLPSPISTNSKSFRSDRRLKTEVGTLLLCTPSGCVFAADTGLTLAM